MFVIVPGIHPAKVKHMLTGHPVGHPVHQEKTKAGRRKKPKKENFREAACMVTVN